jgi:hypothetical protein
LEIIQEFTPQILVASYSGVCASYFCVHQSTPKLSTLVMEKIVVLKIKHPENI